MGVTKMENIAQKRFSTGAINATIWTNKALKEGKEVTFSTVSFGRRYQDKDGSWKTTSSLRTADLPKAVVVLNKAYEYLTLKKTEES